MNDTPRNDHFRTVAMNALGGLLERRGYAFVHNEHGVVEYSMSGITIGLHYDHQRSFEIELNVELGEHDEFSFPFTLSDLVAAFGDDSADPVGLYQGSDDASIEYCVQNIVNRTRPLLDALESSDAHQRLASARAARADAYNKNNRMTLFRADLAEAWNNKDYPCVIRLCEQPGVELSGSDQMKYDHARKMSGMDI